MWIENQTIKNVLNIKFPFLLFFVRLFLVVRIPFCLLNDAVLVEEIRQGRRI